jgi:hypothetical protein
VVPIADEEAKFEEFEGFECIQDDIDKLRIDILKLRDIRAGICILIAVSTTNCNQRLIAFKLLEEFFDGGIDDGDDVDNFLHDFILHKNVTLCFNDLHIHVVILLFVINNRVFGMEFVCYF